MDSAPLLFLHNCFVPVRLAGQEKHVTSVTIAIAAIKETCRQLYRYGWSTINVDYSGSGDEMGNFDISFVNDDGPTLLADIDPGLLPPEFNVGNFVELLIRLLPDGFDEQEGSDGTMEIALETGEITIHHDAYYVATRSKTWRY